MTDRPKPPEPYETWLDYAVDHVAGWLHEFPDDYLEKLAREELEELRAEVTELHVRRLSPTCKTCNIALSLDCPSCKKLLMGDVE